MVAIKSYTNIEQSKKLAEILPLESADMYWKNGTSDKYVQCFTPFVIDEDGANVNFDYDIPCWSLAALLDVLPKKYYPVKDHQTDLIIGKPQDKWYVLYWDTTGMQDGEQTLKDNAVDACYEMILKLHEQNLL